MATSWIPQEEEYQKYKMEAEQQKKRMQKIIKQAQFAENKG